MKIKIGNYPKWHTSNIHTRLMQKRYGMAYDNSSTAFEHFVEHLEHGLQWFYNNTLNRFSRKERSVKIRIDAQDVWSMQITLALIIHPMLLKLKWAKHGSPHVDDEDAIGITDIHEQWNFVLDEMIWTFGAITTEDIVELEHGTPEYHAYQLRRTNGLRLFAKYYDGLWD